MYVECMREKETSHARMNDGGLSLCDDSVTAAMAAGVGG